MMIEPMTAMEVNERRAQHNQLEYEKFKRDLKYWLNKGANQMQALQVKGTEEFREPTAYDVVWNDQIIGCDPDPNVRAELLREAQSSDSGGSMLRKAQASDG